MDDEKPKPVRRTSRKKLKSNGVEKRDGEEIIEQKPVSRSKKFTDNLEVQNCFKNIDSELNSKKVDRPPVEKRRNNSFKKSVRKNKAQGSYSQVNLKNDFDVHYEKLSARSKSEKNQTRKKKSPIKVENDENDRCMLLNQIHQGMKLKSTKHLMVDKSGPNIGNVKQKVSNRSDDSRASRLPGEPNILRRDIPKDNKKCSPLNLAAELKKKMKIIEEKEYSHNERDQSSSEDSPSKMKPHAEIRPPLPPKPKFSSNLNLKDTVKNDKKFGSLRNFGKQRDFNKKLEMKIHRFKVEKVELTDNILIDDFEYFGEKSEKMDKQKNPRKKNEINRKVQSNVNISSIEPAASVFQNSKKVLSKLLSADSEDFENLQVNDRVSKSSKSIDKIGKDLSDNRFERISSVSNINKNLKYQTKHVTNLDDDETEDEDTETESSSLSSQTIATQVRYRLSKQINDHQNNNKMPSKNIKSKFASAKKFLERFHSSSQEPDTHNNTTLTSTKKNKLSNNQNEETFFEINTSNRFLNRFLSKDDSNRDVKNEYFTTNASKINISESQTKVNEVNTTKERALLKTRSAGVGKVPLKRPKCPPPLPPNFPPPPPPNQVLSNNAFLAFKSLEDRFTFHNVSEFPLPPTFHSFTPSPTIGSGERFYQQPRANFISHQKTAPDPYETTV